MQFQDAFDKACDFIKDHFKSCGWDIEWLQTIICHNTNPGITENIYELQFDVLLRVWSRCGDKSVIVTLQFPDTSIDTSLAFTAMSDDDKSRALNNLVEVFGKWRNMRKRQR